MGEKREAWKMVECGMGATTHRLKAPVWSEEEGSQESGGQRTEQ